MSHLGDALGAYLDGEIDDAERSGVTVHLAECEVCRAELGDVSWARSAVRGLPVLALPGGLAVRGSRRPRRGFRPVWAWAASAFAVTALALGLVIAPGQVDTAFDIGTLVDRHVARVVVDPGISTIRGPVNGP